MKLHFKVMKYYDVCTWHNEGSRWKLSKRRSSHIFSLKLAACTRLNLDVWSFLWPKPKQKNNSEAKWCGMTPNPQRLPAPMLDLCVALRLRWRHFVASTLKLIKVAQTERVLSVRLEALHFCWSDVCVWILLASVCFFFFVSLTRRCRCITLI